MVALRIGFVCPHFPLIPGRGIILDHRDWGTSVSRAKRLRGDDDNAAGSNYCENHLAKFVRHLEAAAFPGWDIHATYCMSAEL